MSAPAEVNFEQSYRQMAIFDLFASKSFYNFFDLFCSEAHKFFSQKPINDQTSFSIGSLIATIGIRLNLLIWEKSNIGLFLSLSLTHALSLSLSLSHTHTHTQRLVILY